MSETLGFSVACYRGDVPLLRGCLASIRHFAPDAPICLIADGDFSTRTFEKIYGVTTIRRKDVRSPDLRKWSFGYGLTKMIALWESPFERFLHIDADAVLWGDIRKNIPLGDFDFVFNEPHELITDAIQRSQYFDPTLMSPRFDLFPWQDCTFFNSGVFATKRNLLDLDDYMRLLEHQRAVPKALLAGDQGILNFMVFNKLHRGEITATSTHLQSVVPVLSKQELESRFQFKGSHPVPWVKPSVVHWAGPKPWRANTEIFRQPMDYFRTLGAQSSSKLSMLDSLFPAHTSMAIDEWSHRVAPKKVAQIKGFIKRLIGR